MCRKILIITIVLTLFSISMNVVNAADCDPIEDPSNNPNRVFNCDAEKTTITKFQYPNGAGQQPTAFDNEYCKVTCKENMAFSVPSIRRVYAGMGFVYPLYLSAQRQCQAEYKNVDVYDKLLRKLVDAYMVLVGKRYYGVAKADYNSDGFIDNMDYILVEEDINILIDIKENKIFDSNYGILDDVNIGRLKNSIINMVGLKEECNVWPLETNDITKYTLNPTVSLNIETSEDGNEVEQYEYIENSNLRTHTYNTTGYNLCKLNETQDKGITLYDCKADNSYDGWTETSTIIGRFSILPKKIKLYSDDVMLSDFNTADKTCLAGERHYVSLTEKTNPDPDDLNNNGYKMTLTVSDIGNNIDKINVVKSLNLTVNCWYQVRNIMSPLAGDYFYDKYSYLFPKDSKSPLLYVYRPIDLKDPFPNREPGANWSGELTEKINDREVTTSLKDRYITSTANTIQNKALYTIKLNNQKIKEIKGKNQGYNYIDFKLKYVPKDYEKSIFIWDNTDIITIGDR